ncbi:hypothetical protein B0H11DRAFT_2016478 [Mycena galericulata]|nr:hypothetical protein B0H11DRAFT_2016478 [Mycena galericulata]
MFHPCLPARPLPSPRTTRSYRNAYFPAFHFLVRATILLVRAARVPSRSTARMSSATFKRRSYRGAVLTHSI